MREMRTVLYGMLGDKLTSGLVLKGARIRAGLSQEELEEITGVIRSNISALENDRLPMTSHYALIFAAALSIHPAEILFPNGNFQMTKEMKVIEKRAAALLKKRS